MSVADVEFDELLLVSLRKRIAPPRDVKDSSQVDRGILIYLIRSFDESLCAEYSDLAVYFRYGMPLLEAFLVAITNNKLACADDLTGYLNRFEPDDAVCWYLPWPR